MGSLGESRRADKADYAHRAVGYAVFFGDNLEAMQALLEELADMDAAAQLSAKIEREPTAVGMPYDCLPTCTFRLRRQCEHRLPSDAIRD